MRNVHTWKTKTEDGLKREVRAEKFAQQWRIQSQLKGEDHWTYHDTPLLDFDVAAKPTNHESHKSHNNHYFF